MPVRKTRATHLGLDIPSGVLGVTCASALVLGTLLALAAGDGALASVGMCVALGAGIGWIAGGQSRK